MILVYDGDCALCRDTVAWVKARDRAGLIQAVPFQESGALEALGLSRAEAERAAWLMDLDGRCHEGAAAINRVFAELGPFWRAVASAYSLPLVRWGEDRLYRWIATHRARIPRRLWPFRG